MAKKPMKAQKDSLENGSAASSTHCSMRRFGSGALMDNYPNFQFQGIRHPPLTLIEGSRTHMIDTHAFKDTYTQKKKL